MNLCTLPNSHSITGILAAWPYSRAKATRSYPRPLPDHSRLCKLLCPIQGSLPADRHSTITWAEVASVLH
jgi:hypothetical protein